MYDRMLSRRSSAALMDTLEARTLLSAPAKLAPEPPAPDAPALYAPHSTVRGKTLGEWSEAWWQWAYSYPVTNDPQTDNPWRQGVLDTADDPFEVPLGVGDVGNAYFLTGVMTPNYTPQNGVNTAFREITIPTGTPVFFPILNAEDSLVEAAHDGQAVTDAAGLYAVLDSWGVTQDTPPQMMDLTIDGKHLGTEQLIGHYEDSGPDGFIYQMPQDNILTLWGYPDGPYETLAVSRGWWVMTQPMSQGTHTLHFKGDNNGFQVDVTYTIHVIPKGQYNKALAQAQAPTAPALPFSTTSIASKFNKDLLA